MHFSKRSLIVHYIVLLVIFITQIARADTEKVCELKVGWEDWKPYIYQEHGRFNGAEYHLLMRLAAGAHCKLDFIELPWSRSLYNLKNNSVDLLYGASYTKERDTFARFSIPYRSEHFVFLSAREQIPELISLSDWLSNADGKKPLMTIGLINDFYYGDVLEPILRNKHATFKTIEVQSDDQLIKMLELKRLDGFVLEKLVAEQFQQEYPALKVSQITESPPEPMYFMFSNSVPLSIVERFNQEIKNINR